MIGKVILDNGYKIEIIRAIKDQRLAIGTKVIIEPSLEKVDLVKTFDSLIDEDTQNKILDKFNDSLKKEDKKEKIKK